MAPSTGKQLGTDGWVLVGGKIGLETFAPEELTEEPAAWPEPEDVMPLSPLLGATVAAWPYGPAFKPFIVLTEGARPSEGALTSGPAAQAHQAVNITPSTQAASSSAWFPFR